MSGHTGRAGEAIVEARLLRENLTVARPAPDFAVDLVVLSKDMTRSVPIQVKTANRPSIAFDKRWFGKIDVVLVWVWLSKRTERCFVFDGLAGVERFLAHSTRTAAWITRGAYLISDMEGGSYDARMKPFEEDWGVIRARLGMSRATVSDDRYRLTRHARDRMDQYEVSQDWVIQTVEQPSGLMPDPKDPEILRAWRAIPEFGNRLLRVVFRKQDDQIIVVSVFFDRSSRL